MTRVFIIHHAPCAKLVNVTGECRIRRGRRVEDPVVLTFDDETERMVDVLYTPVLKYAIRCIVIFTILMLFLYSQSTTRKPEDVYSDDSSHIEHPVPEKPAISPSFEEYSSENLGSSDRSSRFYFSHVVDAFHPLGRSRTPSITKTITHYSTVFTSTKKTSRNTFFVQGCTPLYFPFHICGKN